MAVLTVRKYGDPVLRRRAKPVDTMTPEIKRIIADMLDMDSSDEQWMAKCSVLKEDIQHHVKEEENELFPQVQKDFSKKRLGDLGRQMSDRMRELQEQGEPRQMVFDETESAVLPDQG